MGDRLALRRMLGLPAEVQCPRCDRYLASDFDNYDVGFGNPNTAPGKWKLHVYCAYCKKNWKIKVKVTCKIKSQKVR